MNAKLESFLAKLEGVKRAGDQWAALCPGHDDQVASLTIREGDKGILVNCHSAGCSAEEIAGAVGYSLRDLMFSENGNGHHKKRISKTYDYRDENGELLYQAVRYEPKDFRQRQPRGDGWLWKMTGVRYVPYHLPEITAADKSQMVFIVEGEKDCDRLASVGLIATTNIGGAAEKNSKAKWRPEYNPYFAGRRVCILPDNDVAGRKHAEHVANALTGMAASVSVLELPDLPAKGDVSDWLSAGGTAEELVAMAEAAPIWTKTVAKTATMAAPPAKGPVISNTKLVKIKGEDGDEKTVEVPKTMGEVLGDVAKLTDNWPRVANGVLFVHEKEIDWLAKSAAFFGWLQSKAQVRWSDRMGACKQAEVFHEIQRQAIRYRAIERLPHWPPIPEHYYTGRDFSLGNGEALAGFLDRFCPETSADYDLLLALILTIAWGGPYGARPAWVISSQHGRGVGKSTGAKKIANLFGGAIDVSPKERFDDIKQRLLSENALAKRVALIDNLKSRGFSWPELENFITADWINGKRMYVGDAERPGTLVWIFTTNGASLSTDLAQRCNIIKLAKPKHSGEWELDTQEYIDQHRDAIFADIAAIFAAPATYKFANYTRWGTWERDVLSRVADPGEAQRVVIERRGEVNTDQTEVEIIEDYVSGQLGNHGYDIAADKIHIPNSIMAEWWNKSLNKKESTTVITRTIKQYADEGTMERISINPSRAAGRGALWTGDAWDGSDNTQNDLEERIARAYANR